MDDYRAQCEAQERERHTWADAFAKALGADIDNTREHGNPCWYLRLSLQGVPFGIRFDGRNKADTRATFSTSWPSNSRGEMFRPYGDAAVAEPTVSLTKKTPEQAAKDFLRRFWPAYQAEYVTQLARASESSARAQSARVLAVQLAEIVGDWKAAERAKKDEGRGNSDYAVYGPGGARWSVYTYGGVKLDISISDAETAVKVARLLAEALPKED